MYWECNEFQASESYPDGMPPKRFGNVKSTDSNPCNLRMEYHSDLLAQQERASSAWETIVQAYSQCNLTKEGDKLVAISAIARETQPLMECRSLRHFFLSGLVLQEGGEPGVYTRVGCLNLLWEFNEDDPISGIIGHFEEPPEAGVPPKFTRTELGMKKIRIV